MRGGGRFIQRAGARRRGRQRVRILAAAFAASGVALTGCAQFPDSPNITAGCRAIAVEVEGGTGDPQRSHIFAGPEDITIDHAQGIAFISASPRAEEKEAIRDGHAELPQGDIYALDLDQSRIGSGQPLHIRNLTRAYSDQHDFHPHGMSLQVDPVNNSRTLLVINHAQERDGDDWKPRDVVIRFRAEKTQMVFDREIALGNLCNANDVAAVDADRFIVTSLGRACDIPGKIAEVLQDAETGSIVLFDRGSAVRQWSGLRAANGVAIAPAPLSSGAREVYVADSRSGEIRRYTISFEPDPVLIDVETVLDGAGGVDNIEWSSEGELSVATHPNLLRFSLYGICRQQGLRCAAWPAYTAMAPSAAFRFRPGEGRQQLDAASLTYADDGTQLSASSVAAVDGTTMLIGSVFSDELVVCDTTAKRN